jgi:hypothetical protein
MRAWVHRVVIQLTYHPGSRVCVDISLSVAIDYGAGRFAGISGIRILKRGVLVGVWGLKTSERQKRFGSFSTPECSEESTTASVLRMLSCLCRLDRRIRTVLGLWDNGTVHRAAENDFDFRNREARGSVCNGLLGHSYESERDPTGKLRVN